MYDNIATRRLSPLYQNVTAYLEFFSDEIDIVMMRKDEERSDSVKGVKETSEMKVSTQLE